MLGKDKLQRSSYVSLDSDQGYKCWFIIVFKCDVEERRQDSEGECYSTVRQVRWVSAVSHGHWGHLISVARCLTLHLTHHVESRPCPGSETCLKIREENNKQNWFLG